MILTTSPSTHHTHTPWMTATCYHYSTLVVTRQSSWLVPTTHTWSLLSPRLSLLLLSYSVDSVPTARENPYIIL